MDAEHKERFLASFRHHDPEGTGLLDENTFHKAVRETHVNWHHEHSKEDFERLVHKAEKNHAGKKN
jgi:Ca2+-binding EF-hand superfamily protein